MSPEDLHGGQTLRQGHDGGQGQRGWRDEWKYKGSDLILVLTELVRRSQSRLPHPEMGGTCILPASTGLWECYVQELWPTRRRRNEGGNNFCYEVES